MITQLGRPSKDPDWAILIQHSDVVFEDDHEENDDLLFSLNSGVVPRGCHLMHNGKEDRPHWRCRFYLAGDERVIAKGTLFQCAKFYDYALIFFDKYRVKKDALYRRFNFDERDGESDMLREPGIAQYLESLEKHLLSFGDLLPPDVKKAEQDTNRRLRQKAWRKKGTGTYQILSYMKDLNGEIVRLNSEVAANNKAFEEMNKKLDALIKLVQVKPT